MPVNPPRLTCLFFSDTTVAAFLNTPAGRPFGGDLLVECALRPAFGYVLNLETPANYPGVAGLLGGVDIGTLSHPTERLPAPILLAAGAPAAAVAVRGALAKLRQPDERLAAVTLLVSFSDARFFGAALAVADTFAVAWDAAAFPHEELGDFARWLAAEKLLTGDNFAGFFPYASEPLDATHTQRLAALLTARPPLARSEILAAH